jgi:hypothetical protein
MTTFVITGFINLYFPCSISNWNRLSQPIILGRSVGTFKAIVSSIMYICIVGGLDFASFYYLSIIFYRL